MITEEFQQVASELKLNVKQVAAVAVLLQEGATIPFISRYRKEVTGSLDEVSVTSIRDRLVQIKELQARRDSILKSLTERNLLTPELQTAVESATTVSKLEDIYQPYRPKKRTRAMIAKEKGLEPLSEKIWAQEDGVDPENEAKLFVDPAKEVASVADALAGARDILAERISDDADARGKLRELFWNDGVISSKVLSGKEEEGAKFRDYFEWSEPVKSAPSHRILAMRRGENEGILLVRALPSEEAALASLRRQFVKGTNACSKQMEIVVEDAYKRLLKFSMEGETRLALKKKADEEAIRVFAENFRELLLASPMGQKRVLALDPGFRTGCKLVCLDAQGKLLHNDVIYPETGRAVEAAEKVRGYVKHFQIEAIAVGNGTASRETEQFLRGLGLPASIPIVMVNESGASVYSASEVARQEFPDHDLTVRGAVSIGRRLLDPLAELVKIEPKAIGVGQYQHDVDQIALERALDDTVMSCVNAVGVEVNTASPNLLRYVSGLNAQIAANIVAYRNENGPFQSRDQLKQVPRLGPKAFEQAAGFLRIQGGEHPLDASAVHPERYHLVDVMAKDMNCAISDLLCKEELRKKIDVKRYVSDSVGLPTLNDILQELAKPGRDPRKQFELFAFADGVNKIADLMPGMKVPGIVTNVTAFGAFVDVGVHQDGLVHISQLADRFISAPSEVVKVGQRVEVTVIEVDIDRKRISLSMKSKPELESRKGQTRERPEKKATAGEKQRNTSVGGNWFDMAMGKSQ